MLIVNFVISIVIIIIIFMLISFIIKSLIHVFTQYEYPSYYLFLPTFLILGIWSLNFILWYFSITYILKIDIIKVIIGIIIKEGIIERNIIFITLIFTFISLLMQAFAIMTINIDYKKITGNTRFFFKKILKIRTKSNKTLVIKDDPEKLGFVSSLLISILSFIIIIFFILISLLIGFLISKKLT